MTTVRGLSSLALLALLGCGDAGTIGSLDAAGTRDGASGDPDGNGPAIDGASGTIDGGGSTDGAAAIDGAVASQLDPFGVPKLYPTVPGGREWFLPDDADNSGGEWQPGEAPVEKIDDGVFHTPGNDVGQVRMTVTSPSGKAWWRDVEMTGYFRMTGEVPGELSPRWELHGRGERHSGNGITGAQINSGVAAPAGTTAWPNYPWGNGSINVHCVGSGYHGNVYPDERVLFEKEITHTGGYGEQRGEVDQNGFQADEWFGMKFIMRNRGAGDGVHLEVWVDEHATNEFVKLTETDDTGGWEADDPDLDGCSDPPYSYESDEIIDWAGPWMIFRSDGMAMDFKSLSLRDIGPT